MKENASWGSCLLGWLQHGFVLSKTVPFIWGLVMSHVLVQNAVVDVLMDFFTDEDGHHQSLWKAAILRNLVDMISAVLEVAMAHVSDTYTGPFTVIIFCAAAYAMGLMVLGIRGMLIFAVVLIALGKAGEEPTSEFFYDQLTKEKANKKRTVTDKEEEKCRPGFLWRLTASFTGAAIAIFWLGTTSWLTRFKVSSLVMEIVCLSFFPGILFYYNGETTPREEASGNNSDAESRGERNETVRTEERLRDMKSLETTKSEEASKNISDDERGERNEAVRSPPIKVLLVLGFIFISYSLVFTCGDTYFVVQTSKLDFNVGEFDVPVIVFFVLQSSVASVVRLIQSRLKLLEPIWSMAVGMFCSAPCCFWAWLVERGSLPLSIWVLTPQYLLLGLMEGFAEFGLESFLRNQLVLKSTRKFVYPGIVMLSGIGRFFCILFALIFVSRIRLDWCFLILASQSFVFSCIYAWFAKFQTKGLLGGRVSSNVSRSCTSSDAQPSQQENGEAASHVNRQLGRSNTIRRKNSREQRVEV